MIEETPRASVNIPTIGGITAPPQTAKIINPEISLAYSGFLSIVRAKISGKIFEKPNPVIKISTHVTPKTGERRMPTNPKTVSTTLAFRKILELTFLSRMAPRNRPAIREAKYTLIPRLAVSRLMAYLLFRKLAIFELIETSNPTIKKMAKIMVTMKGFLKREKTVLRVAGSLSGFTSTIFTL